MELTEYVPNKDIAPVAYNHDVNLKLNSEP